MATPLSVDELVLRSPSKRGLAVIVTNDYSAAPDHLETLAGPKKDGNRMKGVFEQLQIATFCKHNIRKRELEVLLTEIARLQFPPSYKSISFLFSGHGKGEAVCLQYGGTLCIQDIINALLPQRAPNLGNIPKLFFFDACRGSHSMQPVMVARSGRSQQPQSITDRGATDLKTVFVPPEGNTLVAYSNILDYRAMEGSDGGVWMKVFASQLIESRASIETVLTEVRQKLQQKYQDSQWHQYMQLPETISRLLEPVYLNPQSQVPPAVPALPQNGSSPPGIMTQRDVRHPAHYRGRLLSLIQQSIIKDVIEDYQNNFVCVLKFTKCSNNCVYNFKSEKEFKSKTEAKENAAKIAVHSLDLEAGCTPVQVRGGQKKTSSTPVRPAATNQETDPKVKLKEHCDKNGIAQPNYEPVKTSGDQNHKQRVTVMGKTFVGDQMSTKKLAEKSAAQKALNGLKIR